MNRNYPHIMSKEKVKSIKSNIEFIRRFLRSEFEIKQIDDCENQT